MPELPEVETVVRGLRKTVTGKIFRTARVLHPKPLTNSTPRRFRDFIKAETILKIERFGKYIWIRFAGGKSLVCHLRMTGKFIFLPGGMNSLEEWDHIRLIFDFQDGSCLYFKDLRIFGTIQAYHPGEKIPEKSRTGVEPLSPALTADYLLSRARGRRVGIKIFLLDQKVIAGLGNIYACEILFHCRMSPFLETGKLNRAQAELLIEKIREILRQAISNNGTSIRDFRNIDSKNGRFQNWLQVYGKKGSLCRGCEKTTIIREVQGQRATFFCPLCQEGATTGGEGGFFG